MELRFFFFSVQLTPVRVVWDTERTVLSRTIKTRGAVGFADPVSGRHRFSVGSEGVLSSFRHNLASHLDSDLCEICVSREGRLVCCCKGTLVHLKQQRACSVRVDWL